MGLNIIRKSQKCLGKITPRWSWNRIYCCFSCCHWPWSASWLLKLCSCYINRNKNSVNRGRGMFINVLSTTQTLQLDHWISSMAPRYPCSLTPSSLPSIVTLKQNFYSCALSPSSTFVTPACTFYTPKQMLEKPILEIG